MKITIKNIGKAFLALSVIVSILCYLNTPKAYADLAPATLSFTVSIGTDETSYERDVGETFNVTIMVNEVTDLYTWQVKMYYNADIIKCVDAFYPLDHVFAGKPTVQVPAEIDNVGNGSVLFGCTLLGAVPRFNGTGKLGTFTFNGTGIGISSLHFSEPYGEDTFLYNYDFETIPAELVDGTVNIIPEFPTAVPLVMLMALFTAGILLSKRRR